MSEFQTQSATIGELAKALAKAQAVMPVAAKSKDNPFFKSKYADLPALVHVTRKPLTDNGLSVSQVMIPVAGQTVLKTVLMHTSGEWMASYYPIHPVKNDPQSLGSAVSYARRYSYAPAIGLVTDDAEDDDGNTASGLVQPAVKVAPDSRPAVRASNPHPNAPISSQDPEPPIPASKTTRTVSEAQVKRMYALLKGAEWKLQELDGYIERAFGFKNKMMLSREQYDHVCSLLENKIPFADAWDHLLERLAARAAADV